MTFRLTIVHPEESRRSRVWNRRGDGPTAIRPGPDPEGDAFRPLGGSVVYSDRLEIEGNLVGHLDGAQASAVGPDAEVGLPNGERATRRQLVSLRVQLHVDDHG